MAFTWCVSRGDNQLFVESLEGRDELSLRVVLGHDDDSGDTVAVVACLSPHPGHWPMGYEFVFFVTCCEAGEEPSFLYDGRQTKRVFSAAEDRAFVLGVIVNLVEALIDAKRPGTVTWTTHDPDLPARALAKHHLVCEVGRRKGYRGGQADPYHGLQNWMLERAD